MFVALVKRHEMDEAEAVLTRALAIREKASGAESAKTADVLDDLGDLHAMQASEYDREATYAKAEEETAIQRHGRLALEYYTRALAIREKVLKPDDPDIADSLYNLSQLAYLRDEPEAAEAHLNRWLAMQDAAKSPPSERRAKVLMMLAISAIQRKDFEGADALLAKAQAMLGEVDGKASEEYAGILSTRAAYALEAKRFDDADAFFQEAIAIQSEVSGKDSAEVVKLLIERAEGALMAKRFDAVDASLKEALAHQSALIGPDDPDVAKARELMAGRYQDRAQDPRAPILWHRITIADREIRPKHEQLVSIWTTYLDLLRQTNSVVPQPTEEDLAYLKKVGAVFSSSDLEDLAGETQLLDSDKLDDEGLSHIARLYNLDHLFLNHSITDVGIAHVKGLINLQYLSLPNSDITDDGLRSLAGLENLEKLHVSFTRVSDAGLASLKSLPKLAELNLAYTNVTDAGLDQLKAFNHLRSLDLQGTRVTKAAVDRLRLELPELSIEYSPGPGYVKVNPQEALPVPAPELPPDVLPKALKPILDDVPFLELPSTLPEPAPPGR
jgi:tetratricopeptide (TPR) repeat protein